MQALSDGMPTPFDSYFIAARSRVKPSASHNQAPRSCVGAIGPRVKCYGHHAGLLGYRRPPPSAAFFHHDSTLFALGPAFFVPGESALRRRPALKGCDATFGHTRNASQIPHPARLPRSTTFSVHYAAFFARGTTFLSCDTTTNAPGRALLVTVVHSNALVVRFSHARLSQEFRTLRFSFVCRNVFFRCSVGTEHTSATPALTDSIRGQSNRKAADELSDMDGGDSLFCFIPTLWRLQDYWSRWRVAWSPNTFTIMTATRIMRPGNSASHGAVVIAVWA